MIKVVNAFVTDFNILIYSVTEAILTKHKWVKQ